MINVISKKVEEPKVYKAICDGCDAELEYTYEDTYEGYAGMRYIRCPECGYEIMSEYLDGIKLNSQNIEFPKHFYKFKGVDIDDQQIQKWVSECLKCMEESDESYGCYTFVGSGNSMVFVFKHEDDYSVYVAKNYWEVTISR